MGLKSDHGSVIQTMLNVQLPRLRAVIEQFYYCKSNTILPGNQIANFCAVVTQLSMPSFISF